MAKAAKASIAIDSINGLAELGVGAVEPRPPGAV